MVMGVQRSGTTALFRCLEHDPTVTPFMEMDRDAIYRGFYLRPEPQIRMTLRRAPGTVLLKPISETYRRTVSDVFDEFHAYDVKVVWIYRDPVDVVYSMREEGWIGRWQLTLECRDWVRRNQLALQSLRAHGDRI